MEMTYKRATWRFVRVVLAALATKADVR